MSKKITNGKIRWALNIILIILWAAVFCIAFIKGVIQNMLSWWGPSAYEVYPTLLFFIAVLTAVRLYCVENRKSKKKP